MAQRARQPVGPQQGLQQDMQRLRTKKILPRPRLQPPNCITAASCAPTYPKKMPNMGMAGRRQPAAEMEELQSMTARGAPLRSEACRENYGDATKTGRANVNAFSAVGRLVLYGKLVGADWVLNMWILAKGFAGWTCWLWAWKDVHCGVSASPPALADCSAGVCGRADGACPLPWGHCILGCLGGRVVCSWYDAPG